MKAGDNQITQAPETKRRQGGRKARKAQRAAGVSADLAPVRPGFESGRYKPLQQADVEAIHRAALTVLDEIGMGEVPQVVRERALARGCRVTETGRVLFPRAFVEDIVAGAARRFVLHGRAPEHDIEVGGERVYYGTGGAAVQVLDMATADYRPATLADLYDFARLADRLDNVCWFTRCVVATDVPDPYDLDINTAYAIAAGTSKHIGTSFFAGKNVAPVIAMFDTIAGREGAFRARPFCKVHISPVVSPLRYGADAVDVMLAAIEHRMPINSIIAAQSGATAPAPLAGMLVQSLAETLAGLVLVNMFEPGYPVIFSNWPFVVDLRTGAFSGSGGEIALLNAAAAQMANFYDLPGGVSASMSDSKIPDVQAGVEKAVSTLATGLAGGNLIYESAGMFASLLGASFEGFVIDNEMLSLVQRVIRGIEVTEETIGLEVIRDVVSGAGHFLGHEQTIGAMERDYYYPSLADRATPQVWMEQGGSDMWQRARDKAGAILAEHHPGYIPAAADTAIRDRFNILLPRERMRAAALTA
ncbi:MAG: trimethylamine methyltransferase family protein [Hyphomicrobiales bacterium]